MNVAFFIAGFGMLFVLGVESSDYGLPNIRRHTQMEYNWASPNGDECICMTHAPKSIDCQTKVIELDRLLDHSSDSSMDSSSDDSSAEQ